MERPTPPPGEITRVDRLAETTHQRFEAADAVEMTAYSTALTGLLAIPLSISLVVTAFSGGSLGALAGDGLLIVAAIITAFLGSLAALVLALRRSRRLERLPSLRGAERVALWEYLDARREIDDRLARVVVTEARSGEPATVRLLESGRLVESAAFEDFETGVEHKLRLEARAAEINDDIYTDWLAEGNLRIAPVLREDTLAAAVRRVELTPGD